MIESEFENTDKLVEELWNEIKTNGMYGRSKNDFYDFVLYILNKYDKNHFLSENDNAYNERLLKINSSRIKSAKKNISVKFMDQKEYEEIFINFIKKLAEGNLPSLNDDDGSYTMIIEDTALRSVIESKLKRLSNTSLDYKINTEIVTVKHEDFIKMLTAEIDKEDEDIRTLLESTIKTLKNDKNSQEIKKAIQDVLNDSDSLQSLSINALKAVSLCIQRKIVSNK